MSKSSVKCNTCQLIKSTDALPHSHQLQPDTTKLQRVGDCPATAPLPDHHQLGSATQRPPSGYDSIQTQCLCLPCRRLDRAAMKLHTNSALRHLVAHLLVLRWSLQQSAMTLARLHPSNSKHRASYETIYAMPVGQLRKELIATLRQARNKRLSRNKCKNHRSQIPDMLSIHVRPPKIEERQLTGPWEGDLIKGEGNANAVGTLVEHTSRLVMLVKLPEFKPASAANVLQGFQTSCWT